MTDEPTKDLSDSEKLDLILSRLAAANEDRSRDTKPLLAELHNYVANLSADVREFRAETSVGFANTNARLTRVERKLDVLTIDVADVRTDYREIEERVSLVEQRPR